MSPSRGDLIRIPKHLSFVNPYFRLFEISYFADFYNII